MVTLSPGPRAAYALGTRSLLLLIPTSDAANGVTFAETDPFPRAHALASALTDTSGAGFSRCRLLLPGRHDEGQITDAITESARSATTLIVYVTGELDVDASGRLALAGPSAEAGPGQWLPALPGLRWRALASAMGRADSPGRLLLADLHATANAWQRLHRYQGSAALLIKPAATALLGRVAPPADTAGAGGFTQLLTTLLRHGDPTGPGVLTLGHVATRIRAVSPRGAGPHLTLVDPDTTHIGFRNLAPTGLPVRRPGLGYAGTPHDQLRREATF
ncbi:hypothetical protein [Streptacidiphilus sp. MAP5-3]|uniref:hypothetical protein n=1 Tax=unclassified Streptacidiphilus TaxID=2643834 RepID=UPI003514DD7B